MSRLMMVRTWCRKLDSGNTEKYEAGRYYSVDAAIYNEAVAAEAGHYEDEDPPWVIDEGPVGEIDPEEL